MINKITVGILALLLLGVLVIIVGAGEKTRMPEKEANFGGRGVENGATVFADACSGCHGIQGEGIPGVAPTLNSTAFFDTRVDEVGWSGSLQSYIESTVAAGRPVGSGAYSAVMPTWGQEYGGPLRPDQVRDVTSYIMNWESTATGAGIAQPEAPGEPISEDATPVEIGEAVYTANGCGGCHGEPYGPDMVGPNLGGIAARGSEQKPPMSAEEYIRESILLPNDYVVEGFPANLMPKTYGDTLNEAEFEGLVQYLLTLE
ncbi:MAG: c-type cytochrome [Chloroflexota bacterium]|nr:c-type cytochrome [Chloroflexota bacterium]